MPNQKSESERMATGEQATRDHADGAGAAAPQADGNNGGTATQPAAAVRDAPLPAQPSGEAPIPAAGPATGKSRLRPFLLALFLVVLAFVGNWGVKFYRYSSTHVSTDDAYLTSDVVQVTPEIGGSTAKVLVEDNQHVQAGDLLVQLDDSKERAALEQANAALAVAISSARGAKSSRAVTSETTRAQVEQAEGGVGAARSTISQAEADTQRARAAVATARAGVSSSIANVATAQAAVQAALAARTRALEGVRSAQAVVQTAQAGVEAAQAETAVAQANADKAARDLARYSQLYRQSAVSAQQVDVAQAAAKAANAQLAAAQQQAAQAQAVVAQHDADLGGAREAVRTADANVAQARSQLAAANDAVTAAKAQMTQSQAQFRSTQDSISTAHSRLAQAAGVLSQAQSAPQQVAVSSANQQSAGGRVEEARAAVRTAEINLGYCRIRAAVSGTISKKSVEVGQELAVGQPLMAIIPDNDIWVVANYKETQLTEVQAGQTAELEVDTFPGKIFQGRVDSIAAGTGATFALLPPDNATGNFTKVVQRVPVKILFDSKQPGLDRLRAGMSVIATIKTK